MNHSLRFEPTFCHPKDPHSDQVFDRVSLVILNYDNCFRVLGGFTLRGREAMRG